MRINYYKNLEEHKEYLDVNQAMIFLGVDRTTLWRWVNKGVLSKKKLGGKNYYLRDEIKELLK